MTITPDLIASFHKALHVGCGLPALRPSMSDISAWRDFLREMEPLEDEEAGGPLDHRDIAEVCAEMKRQRDKGEAAWSLRPVKILRDPEMFRDLVLMARKRRRARPRPPVTRIEEQRHNNASRQVEVAVSKEPERLTGEAGLEYFRSIYRPEA